MELKLTRATMASDFRPTLCLLRVMRVLAVVRELTVTMIRGGLIAPMVPKVPRLPWSMHLRG